MNDQDHYTMLLNAVRQYRRTHPGTSVYVVEELPRPFVLYLNDCGISVADIECEAFSLMSDLQDD